MKAIYFQGAFLLLTPMCVYAQISDSLQGIFATGAWVAGSTPIMTMNGLRSGIHNGPRVDGGFQGSRFAFGVGGRFWILKQTSEIGGEGIDVYALGEQRIGPGDRTTLRATAGIAHDIIDLYTTSGGPGGAFIPGRTSVTENGMALSVGLGHEVPIVDVGLLLAADVLMPFLPRSDTGRRRPVLEISAGLRFRSYRAPPSRPGQSF